MQILTVSSFERAFHPRPLHLLTIKTNGSVFFRFLSVTGNGIKILTITYQLRMKKIYYRFI